MVLADEKVKGVGYMAHIILASHGDLSCGMLSSVKMIVGNLADNITTYSLYPGENPQDYVDSLAREVEKSNDSYLILTDVEGGSVTNAFIQLARFHHVHVISGMNLGLVLEIAVNFMDNDKNPSIKLCVERAREAIVYHKSFILEGKKNDEF